MTKVVLYVIIKLPLSNVAFLPFLTLNSNKSKIIIFGRKTKKIKGTKIFWGQQEIGIVNSWKYLGITLYRLSTFKSHLKELKKTLSQKQNALIGIFKCKHLNNFAYHKKLFNSLILSTLLYAGPVWAWSLINELEAIQNVFYRRLFNLPYLTPEYLLHAELQTKPLKHQILKTTFTFWKKLIRTKSPQNAHWWWTYWLDNPSQTYNPIANFIQELSIPLKLKHIPLSRQTLDQLSEIQNSTNTNLLEKLHLSIQNRINTSTYFPHYKHIHNSNNNGNVYLKMSVPWVIKKFITQLRINPNQISTPAGQVIMSNTQVCQLCKAGKMTWTHLLKFCRAVTNNTTKPYRFKTPRNTNEFYSQTIPKISLPEAWYLLRIVKLFNF